MIDPPVRICFPFTGDVVGGSHISVLGLVRNLDPARYQPLVVPQYRDGAIARLFRDHGVETLSPFRWTELAYMARPGPATLARVIGDTGRQTRFLRDQAIDIVHSNDGRTHATWALPARLAGAKLLWHQRGDPDALGLRLVAPLLAHRVAAVSAFAAPRPGFWSAARKTQVIHSPFDTSLNEDRAAARAALIAELGCDPDTVFIGYFGAFIHRKRPFLFIDAIARLLERQPARPVIGVMFGEDYDGRTEGLMSEHAAGVGASESIRIMGYRTPGPRWLAACDMLMVSAVGEPFGRTLVEAMLVGTPVVATASGGNVEALRDGRIGLLVPPADAGALAAACACLIVHPDRAATLAEMAGQDARHRFGEARHVAQVSAIYDDLLKTRRRAVRARAPRDEKPRRVGTQERMPT